MTTAENIDIPQQEETSHKVTSFRYAISCLRFSDGTEVLVSAGDVVMLVGGNNVGKSQALRDIVAQLDYLPSYAPPCPVVRHVELSISEDESSVQAFVDRLERIPGQHSNVGRMGGSLNTDNLRSWLSMGPNRHAELRRGLRAFTTFMVNTEHRLQVTKPVAAIDLLSQAKNHPFHYLADDLRLEEDISSIFRKAFGADLIVNRTAGANLYLHVGDRPFPKGVYNIDNAARMALAKLPKLHEQGDGMRAFVGCLLWSTAVDYKITLIDEPEAFLHPPQARLLGRTLISRKQKDSQLLIATHSGDLLRGALDTNPNNLRVLRLARNGDVNVVNELKPENVDALWRDSLLRQTNVLDALFHQLTIVCEADADCQFYSAIATAVAERSQSRQSPDALFLPSNGKYRMPDIVTPLRALGVTVRVIADFDVIREEIPLRPLFEALGGQWDSISADWKLVQATVSNRKAQLDRADLQKQLNEALSKVTGEVVPDSTLKEIREAARKASAWAYAKTVGEGFLPSGEVFKRYGNLKNALRARGLYVVPKGELESFCKSVSDHGPAWLEQVCERDLGADPELRDAREFVEDVMWPEERAAKDESVQATSV